MADQNLNIHLKLNDNLSPALNKAQKNMQTFSESAHQVGMEIDRAGKAISQVGTKLIFFGTAVTGAFGLAVASSRKYSIAVNGVLTDMDNSFAHLSVTVATAVVPVLEKVSNAISNIVSWFNKLDPQTRDMILQWSLVGGVMALVGGIALKAIGSIISLVGKVIAGLNPWTIALAGIVAVTVLIIKYWDQVREVVMPIITAMEMSFKGVEWIILKVADAILFLVEKFALMTTVFKGVVTTMELLHQIPTGVANAMRLSLDGIKQNVTTMRSDLKSQITKVEADLVNISNTGVGAWARNTEQVIVNVKNVLGNVKNLFQKGSDDIKQSMFEWTTIAQQTVTRVAQSMATSMGNFFYNALTGQITSAKQMFVEFGQSVLRIITEVIAKLMVMMMFKAIGGAIGGGLGSLIGGVNLFHQGGKIMKAHSGLSLASSETPIVAQVGEGILSRKGMGALGRDNFESLNRGEGVGGGGSQIVTPIIIQAWDARDVQRNIKAISTALTEELRKNTGYRRAHLEYGR